MTIALSIVGYIVAGVITAAVGYAWDKEGFDRDKDSGLWLSGIAAIWPLVVGIVILVGVCNTLVGTAKLLGGLPHRRERKAEERERQQAEQRNAVRDMWRQELDATPPDSVRHFVAGEMLKLRGEES